MTTTAVRHEAPGPHRRGASQTIVRYWPVLLVLAVGVSAYGLTAAAGLEEAAAIVGVLAGVLTMIALPVRPAMQSWSGSDQTPARAVPSAAAVNGGLPGQAPAADQEEPLASCYASGRTEEEAAEEARGIFGRLLTGPFVVRRTGSPRWLRRACQWDYRFDAYPAGQEDGQEDGQASPLPGDLPGHLPAGSGAGQPGSPTGQPEDLPAMADA